MIVANGRIDKEVDRRIANASKIVSALRRATFKNINLAMTTKRLAYEACILSVLLYGAQS